MRLNRLVAASCVLLAAGVAGAQDVPFADPAARAFEEGRWEEAIERYRRLVEEDPEDGLSLLRIAQAERELGRNEEALGVLDAARAAEAPEAMVDMERALNLAALSRPEEALNALEMADHVGLRALTLLEEAAELDALRNERRFRFVYDSVRARVFPCETMPAARELDFWIGEWEVRRPDGTLAGHSTVTKEDGGCTIREQWRGVAGGTGTSLNFFLPSRDQWRQVWVGSSGTMIDMSGGMVDGAMRMEGTIEYASQDQVVAFRGAWTPNEGRGWVRQRLEEYDLAAQTWRVWFDGFYRPMN